MVCHNSQTYATYAKSNPNPKRQATAYRNLTGTEMQVCVQLVHPHVHYMRGYVINYYTSFYNVYISLHMQLGMHQSTCMQTYMHARCVCVLCVCILHMTACMHISLCMFKYSCVAYLENDETFRMITSNFCSTKSVD